MIARIVFLLVIIPRLVLAAGGLEEWWGGSGMTGLWGGLRPAVEDHGVTMAGRWGGTVMGVVDGGLERKWTFEEELVFTAHIDLARALQWEVVEGLSLFGEVRWRDGVNANEYAGASPVFNPALYQSGKGWRLMPFGFRYVMPSRGGRAGLVELEGGWVNPYTTFIQQPGSKLFRNNMIHSSKGLTANGVGWSSSYAAWGGSLKLRPTPATYAVGGLSMAIPNGAATSNHGFDFAGGHPSGVNGLFALGEVGWTPSWWGMPGKYAFGGYYWGLEAVVFDGGMHDGRWGLYWQVDQMVWQEKYGGDAKGRQPSQQGLSLISYAAFAPPDDNAMPFYFHVGAIYRGLLPRRDRDEAGVAFAFGEYSHDLVQSEVDQGIVQVHDAEGVVEFDYRIQVNRWAYVQPFLQYLIRPGGQNAVPNATVVGMHVGVAF